MAGKHVTDRQVRRYMESRKAGYTQAVAAARAGFSERTGRRVEDAPVLPSQQDRTRRYRTRRDPFVEVWRSELVPMLQAMPSLRATTLLEELQRRYPDRLLRSLQRRVAHWRVTEGPERELIFRQEHPPGRQALSDFTDGGGLGVTLAGAPFPHLLYHFWLASGWQYVKAICGGENFTALTESLQEALWQLGGVPREHRTDRLSAAYGNLAQQEDEAARYAEFCRHYGQIRLLPTACTNDRFCAGFSDACITRLSTRSDDRRPRSAKARNRGPEGARFRRRGLWGFAACEGVLSRGRNYEGPAI